MCDKATPWIVMLNVDCRTGGRRFASNAATHCMCVRVTCDSAGGRAHLQQRNDSWHADMHMVYYSGMIYT